MKSAVYRSGLLAFLVAVATGAAHAADCPDNKSADPGHQAQTMSTLVPVHTLYATLPAELIRMQAAMARKFEAMNALPVLFVPPPAFMMPTPVSTLQNTQDGYRLEIPLPGFKPEDIHVRVDGQLLSISAESASTSKVGDQDLQSRSSRAFAEALTLPGAVKATKLKQSFENGVLILTIPRDRGTT